MLNLTPAEFWDLGWDEFWQLYDGWAIRRQYQLEQTRLLMYAINRAAMYPDRQLRHPRDVMDLPEIDAPAKIVELSEIEEVVRAISLREGIPLYYAKIKKE